MDKLGWISKNILRFKAQDRKYSASWNASSKFNSRRSNVYTTSGGMVASSQALASQAGLRILQLGGNAADAAVAVAACLAVIEPVSTGIGGDAFALFYDSKSRKVSGLNGSGRCPQSLTLEIAKASVPPQALSLTNTSPHSVTVPGAAAAWVDTVEKFGSRVLTLAQILEPAIQLAENGFPVSDLTAYFWQTEVSRLKIASANGHEMLWRGERAPMPGEIMKLPNMGKTFRLLAQYGKSGFYTGAVAEAIVESLKELGGVMTLDDLKSHTSQLVEPISIVYQNSIKLHECPPNGQGLTALIALGILDAINSDGNAEFLKDGVNYIHTLIEVTRLAFADTRRYIADPDMIRVPVQELLSKKYLAERAKLINPNAAGNFKYGCPANSSDTVYFAVVDDEGSACSFINSNYLGFGSAIVCKGFGFTMQSRGCNFSLDYSRPNCLAPGKRPYHTIIPAMVTNLDDSLKMCFGVMGAFMQPQGHVQVLMNMHHFGMSPQQALDSPRFCVLPSSDEGKAGEMGIVQIEEGVSNEIILGLKKLGHRIEVVGGHARAVFGRGQIILSRSDEESGSGRVLIGGCDPRSDGLVAASQFDGFD